MSRRGPQTHSHKDEGNARAKLCRFFNTADGCRRGDDCIFAHTSPSNDDKPQKAPQSSSQQQLPKERHMDPTSHPLKNRDPNADHRRQANSRRMDNSSAKKLSNNPTNRKDDEDEYGVPSDDDDEYGAPQSTQQQRRGGGGRDQRNSNNHKTRLVRGRNTENFNPTHDPCDIRVVVDLNPTKLEKRLTTRDLLLCPMLFGSQKGDDQLYTRLTTEIEKCSIPEADLLKSWHGDTHWIADDSTGWKKQCPTFVSVIDRIRKYFNMDIKATRFNWYKDQSEWKPYHHDAAAVKPQMAKIQNFTVGVSFGCTRDAAFEEVQSKKTICLPLDDCSTYCFSRDTNILWRHGILQVPPALQKKEGRISIIAWGWVNQDDV